MSQSIVRPVCDSRFEDAVILSENSDFNAVPLIVHPTLGSVSGNFYTTTYDRNVS